MKRFNRRETLQATSAAGVLAGFTAWERRIGVAAETPASESDDERIERLAETIMQTPPEKVVELVFGELKRGLSRQQLLAACHNAGARFHGHHSAYVAHPIRVVSDQLASESSMLPLFYYLSVLRFRSAKQNLHAVNTSSLPTPEAAAKQFHRQWKRATVRRQRDR